MNTRVKQREDAIKAFGKLELSTGDQEFINNPQNSQFFRGIPQFEDNLEIFSSVISKTRTSFSMLQIIKRNEEIISEAEVQLVTVNDEGKPIKIPEVLLKLFD